MKDLFIIILTTLLTIAVWTAVETRQVIDRGVASKQLLEIATPFNGRIDIEYLKSLEKPAL